MRDLCDKCKEKDRHASDGKSHGHPELPLPGAPGGSLTAVNDSPKERQAGQLASVPVGAGEIWKDTHLAGTGTLSGDCSDQDTFMFPVFTFFIVVCLIRKMGIFPFLKGIWEYGHKGRGPGELCGGNSSEPGPCGRGGFRTLSSLL